MSALNNSTKLSVGANPILMGGVAEIGRDNKKNQACFIIVYFGNWPSWISHFFQSCGHNPGIHWMIFTDCGSPGLIPKNVFIQDFNKTLIEELVSAKWGTPYRFSYGYKLCDLKPAYGHIFSEYLEDYSYWGYTDLDLVYGDIADFVGPAVFSSSDVITASEKIIVGHFALFRNSEAMKLLYQECPGYLDKLLEEHYQAFDEKCFSAHVKAEAESGRLRLYQKDIQLDDCVIWWSGRPKFLILIWEGEVVDLFKVRKLCYFHFIQSKYKEHFSCKSLHSSERFFIDGNGFHPVAGLRGWVSLFRAVVATLIWTLPYYSKVLLKNVLPGDLRTTLKRYISSKVSGL